MKVLVTGAGGFVGGHLVRTLEAAGHQVIGTSLQPGNELALELLDLRDHDATQALIERVRPEGIVHLAGLAYVPAAEQDLGLAVSTNIGATAVMLDRAAAVSPGCRFVLISSSEVYGRRLGEEPITEDTPPEPANAYSITKLSAEMLARHVGRTREVDVIVARPFNHIGPGQSELFVAPAFARQIAAIEAGRCDNVLKVGNLEARRDFTDVRDVAEAYRILLESGHPGEVYNVCSGAAVSVHAVLEQLLELTTAEIRVEVDPDRMRPSDLPVFCGSAERIKQATGWDRQFDLSTTLRDVLDDWRSRLAHAPS